MTLQNIFYIFKNTGIYCHKFNFKTNWKLECVQKINNQSDKKKKNVVALSDLFMGTFCKWYKKPSTTQ